MNLFLNIVSSFLSLFLRDSVGFFGKVISEELDYDVQAILQESITLPVSVSLATHLKLFSSFGWVYISKSLCCRLVSRVLYRSLLYKFGSSYCANLIVR